MALEENKPVSYEKLSDIASSFLAPVERDRKKAFSPKGIRKLIKTLDAPGGDDVKMHMTKEAAEALSAYVDSISKPTATAEQKEQAEARLTGAMRKMRGEVRSYVGTDVTRPAMAPTSSSSSRQRQTTEPEKKTLNNVVERPAPETSSSRSSRVSTPITNTSPAPIATTDRGSADTYTADNTEEVNETPERSTERQVNASSLQQTAERPSAAINIEAPTAPRIEVPSGGSATGGGLANIPSNAETIGGTSTGANMAASAGTALGGTVSVSGGMRGSERASAGVSPDVSAEVAELQNIQQQISNTLAAIQQEKNLIADGGIKQIAQLADLQRELRTYEQKNPDPQLKQQAQQLLDLRRDLSRAWNDEPTDPTVIQAVQSRIPAIRQELGLPEPIEQPISPAFTTSISSPTEAALAPESGQVISAPLAQAPSEASTIDTEVQGIAQPAAPRAPQSIGQQFGALASAGGRGFIGVGQIPLGPKPSRPINLPLSQGAIAGSLDAAQLEDRRSRDQSSLSGDSILGETPMGDSGGSSGSVLDSGLNAPTYAYTDPNVPSPIAGGDTRGGGILPSSGEEAERSRRLSDEKNRTLQAFAPKSQETSPEIGSFPGAPESIPGESGARPTQQSRPTEQQMEGEDEDEDEQLANLNAQQRADRKQNKESNAEAQQQGEQAKQEARKKMVDYIKGTAGAGAAETLFVTLLVDLAFWNVQAINKYGPQSEFIPDQSFCEDFACLTCDLAMCVNCLFSPPCFIGPLVIMITVVWYLIDKSHLGSVAHFFGG